jgi:hypothetical protein
LYHTPEAQRYSLSKRFQWNRTMLSDEAFHYLIDYSRWRAVNPSKCPCLDTADPAACQQGQSFVLPVRSRTRPRAARRRRSRATRGRSTEPSGSSDGDPSNSSHHFLNSRQRASTMRPPNEDACAPAREGEKPR